MCSCPNRRQVLLASGTGAAALTLAACSAQEEAPNPEEVNTDEVLVALDDVAVGEAKAVKTAEGLEIIVVRDAEDRVHALSAICTHKGCSVEPKDGALYCPCHGSIFDMASGEPTDGPAKDPLPEVAVHVKDGNVVTA